MRIYKIIVLIISLSCLTRLSLAQPFLADSSEVYNYWAQRGIIEMVHAYMEDYIEAVGESKSIVEIVTKKKYEVDFLKNLNDTVPNFSVVSQFLKSNEWSNVEKNLLQPLIENFRKKHPLNATFFETKKSGTTQLITNITGTANERINWNRKEIEILDNYEQMLANLVEPEIASAENTFTFNDLSPSVITTKGVLTIISIFMLGLLVGAWLVFYFTKRKIYSILKEERVYYLDYPPLKTEKSIFHYITLFHVLKRRKDSYKRRNRELQKAIEELETSNRT